MAEMSEIETDISESLDNNSLALQSMAETSFGSEAVIVEEGVEHMENSKTS